MLIDVAQRRRLPDPGRRVGRARRRRPAADLRQVRRGPGRARQAPHQRSATAELTSHAFQLTILDFGTYLAQRPASGHRWPRTAAHERIRPRSRRITIPAGQARKTRTSRRWGGWGSNPGPADYESAALTS